MFIVPSRPKSNQHPHYAHRSQPYGPMNEYYHPGSVDEDGGIAGSTYNRPYLSIENSHPYAMSLLNGTGDLEPESFTSQHIIREHSGGHFPSNSSVPPLHNSEVSPPCGQCAKHATSYNAVDVNPRRDQGHLIDTFGLDVDSSLKHSAADKLSPEHSVDPEISPRGTGDSSVMHSRPRKARREKPRINLAPDQPPTTQGKPRARVYVACLQCRTRKIRCDGAKPVCYNCFRRTAGGSDCNYDPVPKRRGPDKTPGARQRIPRDSKDNVNGAPRRRRRQRDDASSSCLSMPEEHPNDSQVTERYRSRSASGSLISSSISPVHSDIIPSPDEFSAVPNFIQTADSTYPTNLYLSTFQERDLLGSTLFDRAPQTAYDDTATFNLPTIIPISSFPLSRDVSQGFITELENDEDDDTSSISCEPSLNFTRKTWWDSLLSLYISPAFDRGQTFTLSQRESAAQGITSDIRFIFKASNYWFSFFHVPTFFENYFDPVKREKIQPSLVLALLAISTFWQSSELGLGHHGRDRALRFRDEAQSALDASFNAGWIDVTLAQAAWLLALFEVCAHPLHSSERSNSSMVILDSIIRSLSLTFVDADDPNTSIFSPGAVPTVTERNHEFLDQSAPDFNPHKPSSSRKSFHTPHSHLGSHEDTGDSGCSCRSMTAGEQKPENSEHTPLWASTPAWNPSWSVGEIRKESCRRLCWSSAVIAAGRASYAMAHKTHALDLFVSDPSNYALLLSGESIAYSPASSRRSSKDTIWALHDRAFLLWHGCIRMRNDTRATDAEKAQFAVKAWLEADALEIALNKHTCKLERAFIFQGREYIFNTRMCISYEFQRYVPLVTANVSGLFHRNKAKEWLTHQAIVAERFMFGLHTITGNPDNLLARRPFFVFWFMGQISRALSLWECDPTLIVAMDVCKALLPALDYLTVLWPCPAQRYRYESLRERLANACYAAGVSPPPPANLTLPSVTTVALV